MPQTDIIIVSYKDEEPLKECIASINKYCKDYSIIIEDNNVQNRGYTAAVNAGIKKSTADFLWLLNSDAIIKDENTLPALINRFSYGPKVGIVGSMQLDNDNQDRITHGGCTQAFPGGRHKTGFVSMGHCSMPEKQTWVNGASMMLRRSMLNDIGLLDESMFLICSDSDYCFTARLNGYEVWYEPKSQVFHKLNASSKITEWHYKDNNAFMTKWGIRQNPANGSFLYSDRYQRLDLFP